MLLVSKYFPISFDLVFLLLPVYLTQAQELRPIAKRFHKLKKMTIVSLFVPNQTDAENLILLESDYRFQIKETLFFNATAFLSSADILWRAT